MPTNRKHKIPRSQWSPNKGGSRPNRDLDGVLIKLLRKVESARATPDMIPEKKELVNALHQKLLEILLSPKRHAMVQAGIVRTLLDETAGKMADTMNINEHQVIVEIVKGAQPRIVDSPSTKVLPKAKEKSGS